MEFIEIRALAGRVIKTYTRVEWVKHDPISNSTRVPAGFPLSLSLFLVRCERPMEFDIRFRRRIDVNRVRNTRRTFLLSSPPNQVRFESRLRLRRRLQRRSQRS